ncbi:DUF1080 domain-containing protein [candidate division KSB1 bacterium]|nr:DUF1080 domain-containing protein [candidate division KSB1 bacterium]
MNPLLFYMLFLTLPVFAGETHLDSVGQLFDGTSLTGWEITDFGPQGPVYIKEGAIILGMGEGCTGITFLNSFPEIDYEVHLQAKRIAGNDFFCGMTFPVKKESCTLIIGGWGGTVVGLSSIDGLDASENSTGIYKKFERNTWYDIRLRVTQDSIQAWIDSEKVVDFEISEHFLSIRPEVNLSRPFGITSWNTTAALKNIKLLKQK